MSEYHHFSRMTIGVDLAGILVGGTNRSRRPGLGRGWGTLRRASDCPYRADFPIIIFWVKHCIVSGHQFVDYTPENISPNDPNILVVTLFAAVRMAHSIFGYKCGRHIKLCDISLTCVMSERFRDEYRTHYRAPYKCSVYFFLLTANL